MKLSHLSSTPLILGLLLAGTVKVAHAIPNLALTCWSNAPLVSAPQSCAAPTWHTPSAATAVTTQAGAWMLLGSPVTPVSITLCSADVAPGAQKGACPQASILYAPACRAAGQTCPTGGTVTPTPESAAVITWSAPTTDTYGHPLTVALTYNIYRGTVATSLTKLTNVSALTYTDPAGGSVPVTYYYAVTATCASCQESEESAVVSATLAATRITPQAPANAQSH